MHGIGAVLAKTALGIGMIVGACAAVYADDWQAIKLRGSVFAYFEDSWVQIGRGDVVPDDRIIRTASNGRVQFQRSGETIELGPDTQIRIFDQKGKRYTIVQEHFGEVAIEAAHRDVQHFAVQTQYLAAVVKGTRFTVRADKDKSTVSVSRGLVEVRDTARRLLTAVKPGQSAEVGLETVLSVRGSGTLQPVVSYTGQALAETVSTLPDGGTVSTLPDGGTVSTLPDGDTVSTLLDSDAPPGLVGTTPGLSDTTPSDGAEPPGLVESTPGQSGTNPGKSESAPGHNKD
jgi:hypothetical protein